MKIDKRYGSWNLINATMLDDLAYFIYLKRYRTRWKNTDTGMLKYRFSQSNFKFRFNNGDSYKEAKNIITIEKRQEKILKLKNKINETIKRI